MLLELEAELDRRSALRARELRGKVRPQLISLNLADAREASGDTVVSARRGSFVGCCHGSCSHCTSKISRRCSGD
jgi:hypothetical protein